MVLETDITAAPRSAETPATERRSQSRRSATASAASRPGASFAKVAGEVADSAKSNGAGAKKSSAEKPAQSFTFWQGSEFSFGDFIDIINPLQHLPIVATVYRNLTGDRIGMAPRVIGGALWGRIGGFVAGIVNAAVEWFTGKDIGDHLYAAIWGKPETTGANTAVARTGGSQSPSAAAFRAPSAAVMPDREPTTASGMELRQESSSPPREAAVAPLSSLRGTGAAILLNPAFMARYRNDGHHADPFAKQKQLRVTA